MRIRTVYSFKYINNPAESGFFIRSKAASTNVAIAYKTKVEMLKQKKDGLNQQKFQAIASSGWI